MEEPRKCKLSFWDDLAGQHSCGLPNATEMKLHWSRALVAVLHTQLRGEQHLEMQAGFGTRPHPDTAAFVHELALVGEPSSMEPLAHAKESQNG